MIRSGQSRLGDKEAPAWSCPHLHSSSGPQREEGCHPLEMGVALHLELRRSTAPHYPWHCPHSTLGPGWRRHLLLVVRLDSAVLCHPMHPLPTLSGSPHDCSFEECKLTKRDPNKLYVYSKDLQLWQRGDSSWWAREILPPPPYPPPDLLPKAGRLLTEGVPAWASSPLVRDPHGQRLGVGN